MIAPALPAPLLLALGFLAPQDPARDPVVARFVLDGEPAVVTRQDLAREVAFRERRSAAGEAALEVLIDLRLVEDAAESAGLSATREEIGERMATIRDALEAQGRSLEAFLAEKGMDVGEFQRVYIAMSIAHEKLVMNALDLDSRSEVRPEMLELWLREERSRRNVVDDPDALPEGVVARIDDHSIPAEELGALILTGIADEGRFKHVRRIVLRRALAAKARSLGITVNAEETRQEVERRRKEVENDPRFQGVPYEQWLRQTQGLTVDDLLDSEQMVATVQQRKIVAQIHPDAALERELVENRAAVLRDHGEKRRIAIVLVRALEEPNEIVSRDFDAALEHLRAARGRLEEGVPFEQVAAAFSEDPFSKVRGGEIGEFFRGDDDVPDAVLEEAFRLGRGEVSEPIRVPQGWTLVTVTRIVPPPDDAELEERLREAYGRQLLEDLVEAARIEMTG